jgi:hypothetical protein
MVKGLQKSHCEGRANGGEIQVFDFAHLFFGRDAGHRAIRAE